MMFKRIKGALSVLSGNSSAIPSNFARNDTVAGHFSIVTTKEYTRINTQGREFFFTADGKFDGTGMSLAHNCSPLTLIK